MVCDKMERLLSYIPPERRKLVAGFLKQLSEEMPEGRYEIDGEAIYAKIMSYPVKEAVCCEIEAHDMYRDIQFTLTGAEGIRVYRRNVLREAAPYDEEADVIFFEAADAQEYIRVVNKPGYFTMLLPEEAHRPQEECGEAGRIVKKGVIKIKERCYE